MDTGVTGQDSIEWYSCFSFNCIIVYPRSNLVPTAYVTFIQRNGQRIDALEESKPEPQNPDSRLILLARLSLEPLIW